MGALALPQPANRHFLMRRGFELFQFWSRNETSLLAIPTCVSPRQLPQTLFRGWMFLLQWEQGVFLQSVPYLASVPDRASQCRGASLSDGKRKWIGNKLIFSQLAVPFFPFDLDPVQNKVADVLQQQRWHYWGLPSLRGSLMPQKLSLSCQLWQVRRQHSCKSPRVSKETPRLSILLTMYLSIGVYHFISKMSDDSVQQTLNFSLMLPGGQDQRVGEFGIQKEKKCVNKGEKILCLFLAPSLSPLYTLLLSLHSTVYGWEKSICLSFNRLSSLQFIRAEEGLSSQLHHRSLGYLWAPWRWLMPIPRMNEWLTEGDWMSEWKTEVDEHLLDNFIYLITSNV